VRENNPDDLLMGVFTASDINRRFDLTIKKGGGEIIEIEKKLFNLSRNLSISDWKAIRGKSYWIKMDSFSWEIQKKRFALNAILNYLANK
jgi:hypothetical protein